MATATFNVEASADDATQRNSNGLMDLVAQVGVWGTTFTLGFRCHGAGAMEALAAATINTATFNFWCGGTTSGSMSGTIQLEDSPTPAIFTTATSNITSRTLMASMNWTPEVMTGGTLYQVSIASILQAFVTKYDGVSFPAPTDIVLVLRWVSGTSTRRFWMYDYSAGNAAHIHVNYTAGAPPTNFTAPLVTAAATALVPDLTPGSLTIDAPVVTVRAQVDQGGNLPTLTPGAFTIDAPLLSVKATVLTPTLTPGHFDFTAPVVSVKGTALVPTLTPGALTVTAPLATVKAVAVVPTLTAAAPIEPSYLNPPVIEVKASALVPTLTPGPKGIAAPLVTARAQALVPTLAPGPLTATAPLVTARAIIQAPTLSPGPSPIAAPLISVKATVNAPQLLPQTRTISPPVVTARALLADPSLTTTGGTVFKFYRDKEFIITAADYPSGTEFYFIAYLWTQNAAKPCYAYLYNVTTGQKVALSEVSSISTGYLDGKAVTERKESVALTFTSGVLTDGTYRVKVGGEAACTYLCGGVSLKVDSG